MILELSIVIPTLNEEQYLPKLLDSLLAQNFKGKLQVIVVDGNSKDKTIQKAQEYKKNFDDLLILKTHKGQGYQRNLGAQKARYDHLLFLDADMIVPTFMLSRFLGPISSRERVIGRCLIFSTRCRIWDFLFFNSVYLWIGINSFFSPITSGGFLFTTKENHRAINGFSEGGLLGEDLDYGKRSVKDGARFFINYKSYVLHSSRRSKKMGLWRLFVTYIFTYTYYQRHGVIPDNGTFYYPYGEYSEYY